MTETSSSTIVSTKLEQIARLAKKMPGVALTTLAHHIDVDWLREAYRRTRKDGAPGVDGQSAEQYAQHLEDNLRELLDRVKSGSYRAPAVRRVHIPKGDGAQTRPIGIPTFEDKVLQRAVAMVVEAVYEPSFLERLVWLSPPSLGAPSVRNAPECGGKDGGWLDRGGRHQEVLRHPGPSPPSENSSPTDT